MQENRNQNTLHINQIALIAAITNELEQQANKQGIKPLLALPRQLNTVIAAANSIIREFQKGYQPANPNSGLAAWLESDDTGISSRTMAFHLIPGAPIPERQDHPHDASDFRRCLTLLSACPEAKNDLQKMEMVSPIWAEIVHNFAELEKLSNENNSKAVYELLRKCGA